MREKHPVKKEKSDSKAALDMPLLLHLKELRFRLGASAFLLMLLIAVFYPLSDQIYQFLAHPLYVAMGEDDGRRMIFTGLPEVFLTYLKLSFFAAIMVGFPFFLFQMWRFMAPGLFRHEKRVVRILFFLTPVLFYAGAAFVYFLIFPIAWSFFLGFEMTDASFELPIYLEPKVNEYLGLSMKMMFAFGLAFELPVLLIILSLAHIVSREQLERGRKYAMILIFVFAAIITPPDVISQIAVAVPMLILYELSLLFMRRTETPKD